MPKNPDIKNTVGDAQIENSLGGASASDLDRGYFDPNDQDRETAFEADTWYDVPSSGGGFVNRPRWKSDIERN